MDLCMISDAGLIIIIKLRLWLLVIFIGFDWGLFTTYHQASDAGLLDRASAAAVVLSISSFVHDMLFVGSDECIDVLVDELVDGDRLQEGDGGALDAEGLVVVLL